MLELARTSAPHGPHLCSYCAVSRLSILHLRLAPSSCAYVRFYVCSYICSLAWSLAWSLARPLTTTTTTTRLAHALNIAMIPIAVACVACCAWVRARVAEPAGHGEHAADTACLNEAAHAQSWAQAPAQTPAQDPAPAPARHTALAPAPTSARILLEFCSGSARRCEPSLKSVVHLTPVHVHVHAVIVLERRCPSAERHTRASTQLTRRTQ